MVRPVEDYIPPEELWYHRALPEQVDGDRVLSNAVELPETSFNRGKFSKARAVLDPAKPQFSEICQLRVGDIPSSPMTDDGRHFWEFYPRDAPEEGNEAHAEVRLRRCGGSFDQKQKPGNKAFKLRLKAIPAERMRVYQEE